MAPSARFTEDFAYEVLSVVGEIPEGTVASSAGTKTPASWPGSSPTPQTTETSPATVS